MSNTYRLDDDFNFSIVGVRCDHCRRLEIGTRRNGLFKEWMIKPGFPRGWRRVRTADGYVDSCTQCKPGDAMPFDDEP